MNKIKINSLSNRARNQFSKSDFHIAYYDEFPLEFIVKK